MKCIWHFISYSTMQFAFWASLHNRIRVGPKKKKFHKVWFEFKLRKHSLCDSTFNIPKLTEAVGHKKWEQHSSFHTIKSDIKWWLICEASYAGSWYRQDKKHTKTFEYFLISTRHSTIKVTLKLSQQLFKLSKSVTWAAGIWTDP